MLWNIDEKRNFLDRMGFSGHSLEDDEQRWLASMGFDKGSTVDRELDFLIDQGYTSGSVTDRWQNFFIDNGYVGGSYEPRLLDFYLNFAAMPPLEVHHEDVAVIDEVSPTDTFFIYFDEPMNTSFTPAPTAFNCSFGGGTPSSVSWLDNITLKVVLLGVTDLETVDYTKPAINFIRTALGEHNASWVGLVIHVTS